MTLVVKTKVRTEEKRKFVPLCVQCNAILRFEVTNVAFQSCASLEHNFSLSDFEGILKTNASMANLCQRASLNFFTGKV